MSKLGNTNAHTNLVDTMFLEWMSKRDAVNVPQEGWGALDEISLSPEIISAYHEKHPVFAAKHSKRTLDYLMMAAVHRRVWFSTNTKNDDRPPTCYHYQGNTDLFCLYPDWKIRRDRQVTADKYPQPENLSDIVLRFTRFVDHPKFSRNTQSKFREGIHGASMVLGYGRANGGESLREWIPRCLFCGVEESHSIKLKAAHIVARQWYKAIDFKKKQSYDVHNGILLCDGCHVALDTSKVSLYREGSELVWDGEYSGRFYIPEDYRRICEFVDLRNAYLQSCNPMKTKVL